MNSNMHRPINDLSEKEILECRKAFHLDDTRIHQLATKYNTTKANMSLIVNYKVRDLIPNDLTQEQRKAPRKERHHDSIMREIINSAQIEEPRVNVNLERDKKIMRLDSQMVPSIQIWEIIKSIPGNEKLLLSDIMNVILANS